MYYKTNKANQTDPAALLPAQGDPPMLVKKIGKTTYNVVVHFSETSKETLEDKVKRLILNDCATGDS